MARSLRAELDNTHNSGTEQIQVGRRCQEHLADGIVQIYSLGKGTGHFFAMNALAGSLLSMLVEGQSTETFTSRHLMIWND